MKRMLSAAILATCFGSLAAPALAAGNEFSNEVPKLASDTGAAYFDSDWVCTDNHRQRLEIKHNLGAAPRFFSLYFAPTREAQQVFSVSWSWESGASGNPVTIEVSNEAITLNIYQGAPLHGSWSGGTAPGSPEDIWHVYHEGCFRAFMIK